MSGSREEGALPPYAVRVSRRARRAQLRVSSLGAVEVVVPRRVDPAWAHAFVLEHRQWLHATLAGQRARWERFPELCEEVPCWLKLRALRETWGVVYEPGRRRLAAAAGRPQRLLAPGAAGPARAALRQWLQRRARERIPALARAVAEIWDLPVGRISVRNQRSRWGSCSQRGDLSINRNLLFLPPALARYLLVHELCHTVHLNHSRRFWALVARLEPDYRRLDRALEDAGRYVPLWALPDAE